MQIVLMLVGAIGLVIGSLIMAFLVCWLLWDIFRFVRHPEWTALTIVAILCLALLGALPPSAFLDMTVAFALVAAGPLWTAGREWRHDASESPSARRFPAATRRTRATAARDAPATVPYPAITACIGGARTPTRAHIHRVAARLWRESATFQSVTPSAQPSFATRRRLLRVAMTALNGDGASYESVCEDGVRN